MNDATDHRPGSTETSFSDAAREVTSEARSDAASVAEEARLQAKQVGNALKDSALKTLDESIDEIADRIAEVAGALRARSDRGAGDGLAAVTGSFASLAGTVENVADYLRRQRSEDLVKDLAKAAERQPLLTYASLFALGAAAAYALKSMMREEARHGG